MPTNKLTSSRRNICQLALTLAALAVTSSAHAQADYPNKPIRLVVGFTAGGISDVLGRAIAAKLSNQMGQQVIVDNKPGAGTQIAGEFVAKAAPDGYTLWLQDITTHAINVGLYKNLPYDTVKDFTPITLVASTPLMLIVHPSLQVNTLKELITVAKARKGQLAYSSSGNGTVPHLAAETFKHMAGLDFVHVPYKGSSPATQAVLAGDVAFNFSTMPPALAQVRAGKLRALGVTTAKRVAAASDVPTIAEAGLPGFEFVLYSGILGPKGMPPALVAKINSEFTKAVASPEMTQVYGNIGADPVTNKPDEFATHINSEITKMVAAVKLSGAKIDQLARKYRYLMPRPLLPRHNRYDFHPLTERKDYSWPGGKRLAFVITTNVECFAFGAGSGHDPAKTGEPQTHRNYSWRDYGNRIGIWRFFDLFDELKIPVGHNVNSLLYEYAPQIMDAIRKRGDEFVAHGRTNAENHRGMWEADEERIIGEIVQTFVRHEGAAPTGWMGAGAYETSNTPDLLKEAGFKYLMDWPMDDQPVWLRTRAGPILSVPYPIELNDSQIIIHRKQDGREFCDMITDQFDEMIEQCEHHPLVLNISIHPNVFGQPFRLRLLRQALKHCLEHPLKDRLWVTRPCDIADYCYTLPPGIIPGS